MSPNFKLFIPYYLLIQAIGLGAVASDVWISPLKPQAGSKNSEPAALVTFEDEFTREFMLKSLGELRITNLRGSIRLVGWTQDRIRVRARRFVRAVSDEEGKRLQRGLDLRYEYSGKNAEISAEYGKGLDIRSRLKERASPHTRIDLEVFAPSSLIVRLWSVDGSASVMDWNAPVDVRTFRGSIQLASVRSKAVFVLCPFCDINLSDIRGAVRIMGGQNPVKLSRLQGGSIYVETTSGSIDLNEIDGQQLYVTRSGGIQGRLIQGQVEFHTDSGRVFLGIESGFLSGRTERGSIYARWGSPQFQDRALIESIAGGIELVLPQNVSAEVDFWALFGKVQNDLQVYNDLDRSDRLSFGPEAPQRIRGRLGRGGELLRVFTERGDIKIRAE